MQEDAGECRTFRYALRKFRKDCENFATIEKNFTIPGKFRYAQFFAIIAKVTVHSENLNFRYALYFRYDNGICPPVFLIQTTSFCVIPILSLL